MKQNKLGTFDLTQIAGGPLGNFAQQAGHGLLGLAVFFFALVAVINAQSVHRSSTNICRDFSLREGSS